MDTAIIISGSIALAVAIAHIIERFIYWFKQKKQQERTRITSDLDKLLGDLNTLKISVAYEIERSSSRVITDETGKPIRRLQTGKIPYIKKGLVLFDNLAIRMTQEFRNTGVFEREERIDIETSRYFTLMENYLNHYFTFLHNFIKKIEEDTILDAKDKTSYIDRLRWSLSPPELFILFYFCMSKKYLGQQLKCHIEKYHLFESLPSHLSDSLPENQFRFYHSSAFGRNSKLFLS